MRFTTLTPLGHRLLALSSSKLETLDYLPPGARDSASLLRKGVLVRAAVRSARQSVEANDWKAHNAMGFDAIGEDEEEEEEREREEGGWFEDLVSGFGDDEEDGVRVSAAVDIEDFDFGIDEDTDVEVVEVELEEEDEDEHLAFLDSIPNVEAVEVSLKPLDCIIPVGDTPLISPLSLAPFTNLDRIPTPLISPFTLAATPTFDDDDLDEELESDDWLLPPPLYRSYSSSSSSTASLDDDEHERCATPPASLLEMDEPVVGGVVAGKVSEAGGLGLVFDGLMQEW